MIERFSKYFNKLENHEFSKPKIILAKDLKKEPYDVVINAEKVAKLLFMHGISEEKVKKLKIKIRKEPIINEFTGERTSGAYQTNGQVLLSTDYAWNYAPNPSERMGWSLLYELANVITYKDSIPNPIIYDVPYREYYQMIKAEEKKASVAFNQLARNPYSKNLIEIKPK
jgi:hypothetical protein